MLHLFRPSENFMCRHARIWRRVFKYRHEFCKSPAVWIPTGLANILPAFARRFFQSGILKNLFSAGAAATFFYTAKIFVPVHFLIKKENKTAVLSLCFSIKKKTGSDCVRKCCRLDEHNLPAARFADRILH
ncbi:hypothetical protein [Neisseria sp.]|uniref:hypothetical protein n=1 Tax=Neisseria sp. TaxID=192066 RepID=UPI0026DCC223|nr:hypothetical protein [Neisseria sp.]MDO4906566.1 hypothetical protein [Neisseria sp.]